MSRAEATARLRAAALAARSAWKGQSTGGPPEPEIPYTLRRDHEDNLNMRRLVAFLLREDDNCIDVGAHAGGLLAEICRAAPAGHHVAFEPIPHLADELTARFPTVDVHRAAASNRAGTSTFAHVRAAEGWSGLKFRDLPGNQPPDLEEITVALEPIDAVVEAQRPVALIKIDVEGAEQQVIEGALGTIMRHRPVIILEHGLGSANAYGTEPDDIWRLLTGEAGLRIFDLDGNGPYVLDDLKRTYYDATRVNFVAHA